MRLRFALKGRSGHAPRKCVKGVTMGFVSGALNRSCLGPTMLKDRSSCVNRSGSGDGVEKNRGIEGCSVMGLSRISVGAPVVMGCSEKSV